MSCAAAAKNGRPVALFMKFLASLPAARCVYYAAIPGPNHVVNASASSDWLRSPTHAT